MSDIQKLNAFNGAYYEVWFNHGKPDARCISRSTYALNAEDAIRKAAEKEPADLDLSKISAFEVQR